MQHILGVALRIWTRFHCPSKCDTIILMRERRTALYRDSDRLRELYCNKMLSTYKIAVMYDCDPKTVYRYLKLNNIPTRPRRRIVLTRGTLHRLYVRDANHLAKLRRYTVTRLPAS